MRIVVFAILLAASFAAPASACYTRLGVRPVPPPLAKTLDAVLPKATLAAADLERVKQLRAEIARLAAAGEEKKAREQEVIAMRILGYFKTSARCGSGSFSWMKRSVSAH
jgi:hypothetical protein